MLTPPAPWGAPHPARRHMMPVPSPPLGRALVSALALPGFTGTSLKASAGAGRAGAVRMGVLRWLTASALCIAVWGPDYVLSRPPPQFGSIYHVRGVINLPYAEIEEPFEAWYNLTGNKSRIQYYGVSPSCWHRAGDNVPAGRGEALRDAVQDHTRDHREEGEHQGMFPAAWLQGGRGQGSERLPQHGRLQETKKCGDLPGSTAEHRVLANPMEDLVGRHQPWAHEAFHQYRRQLGRRYGSAQELEHRQSIFVHNMRFVHSRNRAALSYTLALNHLADRTPQELAALRGRRRSGDPSNGQPFPSELYSGLILPESLDWRMYGAVTPVKDQAVCGSCWSFATAGAMEGALFLKTGVLTPLSQQVLIDCAWGFGNEEWRAYEWIKKHGGIATTESYGTYKGQNGLCHYNQSEMLAKITGYVNVTSGNITAVKAAIYKHGPVAVSIDASHKTFSFYSNGIYYEPKCANKSGSLDHAVLAVGYGVLQGETYWLIKNSWSTYWGNDGYILMAMRDNNCGVATEATYPILA
nr:digestive cysteine proteinase 1 isoform X2 [Columba livia]